jgi:hypothetical protein
MLLSGFIITVLYLLVALALFGILVVDGKRWHLRAPQSGIRDLISQFGRGTTTTATQTQSTRFSRMKSISERIQAGSARISSIGRKLNEVKRTEDLTVIDTVQTIDIAPPPCRRDSYSTMSSPVSPRAFDRGRSSDSKTLCEPKAIGLSVPVVATPMTSHSHSIVQATRQGVPLKHLAIKLLWYPVGMY